MRCILLFFIMLYAPLSSAESVTGRIDTIYTSTLMGATAARGYTELQISGQTLAPPCTWLYIHPDDRNALSVVLSAYATEKTVTMYYSPGLSSPWSDKACGITIVVIEKPKL